MALNDGDKAAVATLAVARCAALGRHEIDDYMAQYEEFARRFEEREAAVRAARSGAATRKITGF